jgi:putative oxidoreductase
MLNGLGKYRDEAYAALRIVGGLLFAFHGLQKCFGAFTEHPQPEFLTQVWLGGWIELLGGLVVGLGLRTRLAAFLCSGTMAVAYT